MEFIIRKNSTLPLLKMQVVKDGRGTYEDFMSFIETSTIYFSMQNIDTGQVKINTSYAGFVEKIFDDPNTPPEYYLYYRFSKKDTNKIGRYEGQFLLKNDAGTLILPIREKLNILIKDSLLEDDLDYNECFIGKYECCIIGPPSFITKTPTPTPTQTQTPTVTPTPTQTSLLIDLTLTSIYSEGSINIDYILNSNISVPNDITLNFTDILGAITGSPIVITTGVTITQSNSSGITQVSLVDADFNNLSRTNTFTGLTVVSDLTGYTFNITENNIYPTPTPTPSVTPTLTKTPTPTPSSTSSEQVITDAIITDNIEYINVGNNLYLRFIDPLILEDPILTDDGNFILVGDSLYMKYINPSPVPQPSPTQTPTITPTPSITPTITPSVTPTITPSPSQEPLYPLTLYIQPMSGGQAIIFDGVTYTAETTVNILLNTFYNIESVPIPGYMFVGWNIFGGSFSSTGQSTTVSISLTSGANLAPSYAEDPNYDALEAQLTTSLLSYQNAEDNDWVSITQEEYNNLFNNIENVQKIGNTDEQVNTRAVATGYDTTTFGTVDANTPLTINSGNYVIAFVAESWNQNGQVGLGYTTTYHTGAPTYMGNSPNVIGGMTMFYVRKRPGNVEGAPASTNLYPVLNFIPPAYPNAVPNTYGWFTSDEGINWSETDPAFTTAKIQILLTNTRSWPLPPLPSPSPTPTPTITPSPTPTITPSPTPAAVTATTYVYNIATVCTCDDGIIYSDSSLFETSINVYSDINLTTPYPNGSIYYNGVEFIISSGTVTSVGFTCIVPYCSSICDSYTNYEIPNNSYNSLEITFTLGNCSGFTVTVPPLTLVYVNSNTVPITNCVRQIVVPTLWNGATSINSNTLQLTQTSETLQIQVNDIITDNIGSTSFVGLVSSDGIYTYVYTGPGGVIAFDCQFPLTFSGDC